MIAPYAGDGEPTIVADLATLAAAAVDLAAEIADTVADARQAGASWTAIGAALAVSRQAAQQRYGR